MKVMTIQQFLKNPSGPSSASFARRDLIIENLKNRYSKIRNDPLSKNKWKCDIYTDHGQYYFHLKVPSETFRRDLQYDVVIQLLPIGKSASDLTVNNYAVKVFSNAPNFLFTYAYIYNKDDILVSFLKNKISRKALHDAPVIRNKHEIYGFEKSVYFALLYISEYKYNVKSQMPNVIPLNKNMLNKSIGTCEEKLNLYNRLKYKKETGETKGKDVIGERKAREMVKAVGKGIKRKRKSKQYKRQVL